MAICLRSSGCIKKALMNGRNCAIRHAPNQLESPPKNSVFKSANAQAGKKKEYKQLGAPFANTSNRPDAHWPF